MTTHLLANLIRDKHRRKAQRLMTPDELDTALVRSETLADFDSHLESSIRRLAGKR